MADGALRLDVVIGLPAVTGETEGSRRLEPAHRALRVAPIAGLMGVDRWRVGLDDLRGAVAGGAVPPGGVVVLVTGGAGRHRRVRLEGHPRRVALHARQVAVFRVLEPA